MNSVVLLILCIILLFSISRYDITPVCEGEWLEDNLLFCRLDDNKKLYPNEYNGKLGNVFIVTKDGKDCEAVARTKAPEGSVIHSVLESDKFVYYYDDGLGNDCVNMKKNSQYVPGQKESPDHKSDCDGYFSNTPYYDVESGKFIKELCTSDFDDPSYNVYKWIATGSQHQGGKSCLEMAKNTAQATWGYTKEEVDKLVQVVDGIGICVITTERCKRPPRPPPCQIENMGNFTMDGRYITLDDCLTGYLSEINLDEVTIKDGDTTCLLDVDQFYRFKLFNRKSTPAPIGLTGSTLFKLGEDDIYSCPSDKDIRLWYSHNCSGEGQHPDCGRIKSTTTYSIEWDFCPQGTFWYHNGTEKFDKGENDTFWTYYQRTVSGPALVPEGSSSPLPSELTSIQTNDNRGWACYEPVPFNGKVYLSRWGRFGRVSFPTDSEIGKYISEYYRCRDGYEPVNYELGRADFEDEKVVNIECAPKGYYMDPCSDAYIDYLDHFNPSIDRDTACGINACDPFCQPDLSMVGIENSGACCFNTDVITQNLDLGPDPATIIGLQNIGNINRYIVSRMLRRATGSLYVNIYIVKTDNNIYMFDDASGGIVPNTTVYIGENDITKRLKNTVMYSYDSFDLDGLYKIWNSTSIWPVHIHP